MFGAFQPATGEVLTATYRGRTTSNWVAFLEQVEGWLPADVERVYALLDNLNVHRAWDVLLFNLAHPRWEFVFQPCTGYLGHPFRKLACAARLSELSWHIRW